MLEIKDKQLVNMLEQFVNNAPDKRTHKGVGNKADSTAYEIISCTFWMSKLDYIAEHEDEPPYPPHVQYEMELAMCFGTKVSIRERSKLQHVSGYFDDEWCNNECWTPGKDMNELIIKILSEASYKEITE